MAEPILVSIVFSHNRQYNYELSDDAQQELNIVFITLDLAPFTTYHKWKEKYIFE